MTSASTLRTIASASDYLARIAKVRVEMVAQQVDATLLSVGHDLPYLSGYFAMPLERLTMLVIPQNGEVVMIVPRLEVPRVVSQPGVFSIIAWGETEDPVAIVAKLLHNARKIAIGDQMWARFLVELLTKINGATFVRAVDVVGSLRMSKDASEIAALQAAGAAADRVAQQLHSAPKHRCLLIFLPGCLPKGTTLSTLPSSQQEKMPRARTTMQARV
jgi:Xaa-Pro aminopeptidase